MKNAKKRAEEWLNKNIEALKKENGLYWHDRVASIELLLKEQDKITRHACAEAVLQYTTSNKAHMVCMNVKAV